MKTLLMLCLLVLCGCASTDDFVEGSKMLGTMIWRSAGTPQTTCVSGPAGYNCYTYDVHNNSLMPEQEAEIEAQVLAEMEAERAAQKTLNTI